VVAATASFGRSRNAASCARYQSTPSALQRKHQWSALIISTSFSGQPSATVQ